MNKRLIVILGTLVVAAGIGFIALRGYPPQQGVEGAIGAANRYSETQITDADVTLTDADIQAFLQSDLFHRMQTDADFRAQVMDNQKVLADANFVRAIDPLLSSELDAIRSVSMDGAFWTVVDGQLVHSLRVDAMSSTLDALSEISDAAMSKIAEDHLPQYFPANNKVVPSDAWASNLSDNARRLMGDRAFWANVGADGWMAIADAGFGGRLDGLAELVDAHGFQLDEAGFSLDAMKTLADGKTSLSVDAQRLLADERIQKVVYDRAHDLIDASMASELDAFALKLDEARVQMDAGTFNLDAFTGKLDGQVWRSMDAAQWRALDAVKGRIPDYAKVLSSDGFASMAAADGFANRLGDGAYVTALTSADFWSVMSDEQFSSAISDARWSKFIGTDQFGSALADENAARIGQ